MLSNRPPQLSSTLRWAVISGLVVCACAKDPTAPRTFVAPALEPVPYALLGPGKVAFSRYGGNSGGGASSYSATYIIDATAGSSSHILDDSIALGPVLSPDGRRIAYSAWKDFNNLNWNIYATNIDGSGTKALTSFPAMEGAPTWTPDGGSIVMPVWVGAYYNVFSQSIVPDGTGPKQLTNFNVVYGDGGAQCPVIEASAVGLSVSPRGELAFACRGDIYIQPPTGAIVSRYSVTPPPSATNLPFVEGATWSPDGSQLAFVEIRGDSVAKSGLLSVRVRTMNADGSSARTLADTPFSASFNPAWAATKTWSVCWMPDQVHLVFMVPIGVNTASLWTVKSDGTGLTRLTTAADAFDGSVSCSR